MQKFLPHRNPSDRGQLCGQTVGASARGTSGNPATHRVATRHLCVAGSPGGPVATVANRKAPQPQPATSAAGSISPAPRAGAPPLHKQATNLCPAPGPVPIPDVHLDCEALLEDGEDMATDRPGGFAPCAARCASHIAQLGPADARGGTCLPLPVRAHDCMMLSHSEARARAGV